MTDGRSQYKKEFSWYTAQSIETIVHALHTDEERGLQEAEIKKRQSQYGYNVLPEKNIQWWHLFFRQFTSPLIYILIFVATLSFFLEGSLNALMIIVIVLINTVLSFYQEWKAQNRLGILKEYIMGTITVIRNGLYQEITTKELVLGDILILYPGDIIPADVRFLKVEDVYVDESAITGESATVKKTAASLERAAGTIFQAHNIGFSGTIMVLGKARAVVYATGIYSSIGNIAKHSLRSIKISGFGKEIAQYSRFVLMVMAITVTFIFCAALMMRGIETNILQLLLFICALGVSIVPQALPLIVTISLSQGAIRLAKNFVVVKRLSAIEHLGSMQILCADKTGTLTQNVMSIAALNTFRSRETIFYALMASGLSIDRMMQSHGFDKALWDHLSLDERDRMKQYKIIEESPFTAQQRRSMILAQHNHDYIVLMRGSVSDVFSYCSDFDGANQADLHAWHKAQGNIGHRVMAVAIKKITSYEQENVLQTVEYGFTLLGLIAFEDPIKSTTKDAVKKIHDLGVQIKIVSGDTQEVCAHVAYQVGILHNEHQIITGEEFAYIPDNKKIEIVDNYIVFARVTPEQKYQIIKLLQEKYEVGYVGDGINDVPPLSKADVSLAVQYAVDIAREAADIILLKEDLQVIADGIQIGRETFVNTLKYIKTTLSSGLGNFYSVAIASLLIDFLPMLPLQILLLNLFTDFPMIALSTDTIDQSEIRYPKKYNVKEIAFLATILGLISTFFDFIFLKFFYRWQFSPGELQTSWFIENIFTQLVFIFSIRTPYLFYKAGKPSIILMGLTCFIALLTLMLPYSFIGQTIFLFVTPKKNQLILVFMITFGYFIVTECVKLAYYHFYEPIND